MDQKLRTERRKLADLKAAEYNPRKALTPDDAEYQKIRRSIEEFGYVDPIIINEDGTIIGGHQRATVLKDLGYQEVDVVVVALDKQREKALNIALNKITGEWDEVKLKDLLLDLDLGDYDISLTGFEQNDLTELVDKLAIEPEAVDDDFNEDEALEQAEAEPVTKLGDVWLLGRHRLMCGDSTSQDDMAVLMNGEIADLVVTDPPYNVNYGDKAEMLDEYLPAKGHRNINHIKKTYSQTIGDVKVTSPNPVEVEIRFIMTDGELPTKTVIDGVAAYLQDENIRPLTDKVTVLAPETVKFNIAFTYYVNLSDQSKAGTIQAEVAQAVADYIEWQTRTIGRDINPSELMKRIVAAGAKRAEITSPVFTTVPDTSVARIGTQTVTYGGVEND